MRGASTSSGIEIRDDHFGCLFHLSSRTQGERADILYCGESRKGIGREKDGGRGGAGGRERLRSRQWRINLPDAFGYARTLHLIAVQSQQAGPPCFARDRCDVFPSASADILDKKRRSPAIQSKLIVPPFYNGELRRRTRRYSPEASMRADEDFIISGDLSVPTCRSTRSYNAFIF